MLIVFCIRPLSFRTHYSSSFGVLSRLDIPVYCDFQGLNQVLGIFDQSGFLIY